MKKIYSILIISMLLLLMITACSLDNLFGQNDIASISIKSDIKELDIDEDALITITASGTNKKGDTITPDMVWEYDEKVFSALGTPSSAIRLELNSKASSPSNDITGRTIIKGYDKSNPAIYSEVVINVTGKLQSIWFQDESGSKIQSIRVPQKQNLRYKIGTYPRAADGFELIGSTENREIAIIEVDSDTKTVDIRSGIPGQTTISIDTEKGGFTTNLNIEVLDMEVPETTPQKIVIENGSFMSLEPSSDEKRLTATVYDQYNQPLENMKIEWTSSDSETVSIRGIGNTAFIAPNKVGSSRITARLSEYPSLYAILDISVGSALADIIISPYTPPMPMMAFSIIDKEEAQFSASMPIGKQSYYIAQYLPTDTEDIGVRWSVDNYDVLDIVDSQDDIVIVEATGEGSANLIAASTTNSNIASYVSLSVYDPAVEPDLSIKQISIEPVSAEIEEGSRTRIKATAIFHDGTEAPTDILWSTNGSSAEIIHTSPDSSEIEIEAKSEGITVITATALSNPYISSQSTILVYAEGKEPGTEILGISASPSSISMLEGTTQTIGLSYLPSKAEIGIEEPSVSTDSVSIVEYDEKSLTIKAEKAGNSTIYLYSTSNPSVSTEVHVRVLSEEEAKLPSSIRLDRNTLQLEKGNREKVNATVRLIDGSIMNNPDIIWEITDGDSIVSILQDGKSATIEAINKGDATVKASLATNNEISATVAVLVYESDVPISQNLRRIVPEMDSITITEGKSEKISISYLPVDTTQKGFQYEISDPRIAYIKSPNDETNDEMVEIEAIEKGAATITLTSKHNPLITASINVNVISAEESYTPAYIKLSDTSLSMRTGDTSSITARIFNIINQELPEKTVAWSISKNPDAITIEKHGNDLSIKALKEGIATISASLEDYPDVTATCEIKITGEDIDPTVPLQAIVPSISSLSLIEGEKREVSISYLPANTFEKGIAWSSDSDNIEIDGSDNSVTITGIKASRIPATITATSSCNDEISTTISVSVITEEEARRLVDSVKFELASLEFSPPYPQSEIPVNASSLDSSGNVIQDAYTWTNSCTDGSVALRQGESGTAYLTIKSPGEATIKATSRLNPAKYATLRISVKGALERISISPASIEIYTNGKATLRSEFYPQDSVDTSITWQEFSPDGIEHLQISQNLMNPALATITGKQSGTTEVRAISKEDGKIFGKAEIKVLAQVVPDGTMPERIAISPTALTIAPPFEPTIITSTVYGTNGTIYPIGVKWSIENGESVESKEPIATLSPTGEFGVRVIPKMSGEATITATSKVDESIVASIPLVIKGAIASIRFINLPDDVQLLETVIGTVKQVQVELSASDGGPTVETDLEWYQDGFVPVYDDSGKIVGYDTDDDGEADSEQADMSVELSPTQSGGIFGCSIKANKVGTITLVVRSKSRPDVVAKLTVNILPAKNITGKISISPQEIEVAPDDDKFLVRATIETDEAYIFPEDTEITMEVSQQGLLEFSSPLWEQDGTVFTQKASPGKQPGEGYLTVSLPDYPGIKPARTRVSLGGALTALEPNNPQGTDDVLIIKKGEVVALGVNYIPKNTAEKGISWKSADTDIVTVECSEDSKNAIISGVSAGTTQVIAESTEHPGIEGVRYVFTITVKPVVESVSFSYTNPDTGTTSTGLTFNISNDSPMELKCNIFPEILDDATQLIITPHNEISGSDSELPSMKLINGTVNDYIFTPADGVIGSYQYDIIQESEGLRGEVIDVLTINVETDSTSLVVYDSGQEKIYNGDITYTFSKDNPATEINAYLYDSQLQPLANVKWTSSNINVARIVDNKDNSVTIQMRYPSNRNKCAGYSKITAELGNGDAVITYSIDVYVGVDIPDSLYEALSTISPFKENPIFMNEKVFYPEMARGVKTLNFKNLRLKSGDLVLNDGSYCYLNSDLFPDLEELDISNCRLSSSELSLQNMKNLKVLKAEQPKDGGADTFRLNALRSVPSTLEEANLNNNLIESVSSLSGTRLKTLSIENNQLRTFSDSSFQDSLQTLRLSSNSNLERITITKPRLKEVSANNCPKLSSLDVNSRYLESLSAYGCSLTDVDIDSNCSSLRYVYLNNNKLGEKNSSLVLKGTTIKKSGTSNIEKSSMENKYFDKLVLYANGLYWFGESKNRGGSSVSASTYIGNDIPSGTIISSHQIAYEGHWGGGPSYSGGIKNGTTALSGSNYQGTWSDPDLGSSWCGLKNVTVSSTGQYGGTKLEFYTKQGSGSWANGSRLYVYPFGK